MGSFSFYVYGGLPMCTLQICSALGEQRRGMDSFELELQMVVSQVIWVLGIEPLSSARTISIPNHL